MKSLKIILLGDEKTGKTCFFEKLINDKFNSKHIMSDSVHMKVISTPNGAIDLYDSPGNFDIHKSYINVYKNANSAIVLFDITNKNSLDNVFQKWLPNFFNFLKIKQTANFPIIILGNFSDLAKKRAIQPKDIQAKLNDITKFTAYYFYQEISIKAEKSIINFLVK